MKKKQVTTLCIIHQPVESVAGPDFSRVLLGMKKRGFGAGRWNGFGGKVNPGEDITEAAVRELQEEAGLTATKLECQGILDLHNFDPPMKIEMHVFKVTEFEGTPVESSEMRPKWFLSHEWPFDESWPDDRHWVPLFLAGKKFRGVFRFSEGDEIIEQDLEMVDDL